MVDVAEALHPAPFAVLEHRVGKAVAPVARARVVALEDKGWLRRDAIHAVYTALATATRKGTPLASVTVRPPACRCARPIAARSNAFTCGLAACRMKLLHRRRRDERRKVRLAALFSELLRLRRWRPFTREDARDIGASFRVRPRDMDELLRQLVDEDGAAYRVFAAPGVYGFVPPFTRRLAV